MARTKSTPKRKSQGGFVRLPWKRRKFSTAGNGPAKLALANRVTGNNVIFRFSRTADYGNLTLNAGDPAFIGKRFRLTDLPVYSDITSFFDQFKITCIKLTWTCNSPNMYWTAFTAGNAICAPYLATAIDNDDASTPANLGVLQAFDSYKNHGTAVNGKWVRWLKPMCRAPVEDLTSMTHGISSHTQWIDTSTPDVEFYGIKYAVVNHGANAPAAAVVKMEATFYIEARKIQ